LASVVDTEQADLVDDVDPEGTAGMSTNVCVDLPVLRKGSEGGTVVRLQQMLNVFVGHGEEGAHVEPLKADGVFGPKTEQAVKTFQGFDAGTLAVDGIVGEATWTKLLTMWLSGNEPG
jgi:peptidoglycan hydrolase-like protein with peptidoglycan-binding domain